MSSTHHSDEELQPDREPTVAFFRAFERTLAIRNPGAALGDLHLRLDDVSSMTLRQRRELYEDMIRAVQSLPTFSCLEGVPPSTTEEKKDPLKSCRYFWYEVRPNDFVSVLAKKFKTTESMLRALNPVALRNPNELQRYVQLKIPCMEESVFELPPSGGPPSPSSANLLGGVPAVPPLNTPSIQSAVTTTAMPVRIPTRVGSIGSGRSELHPSAAVLTLPELVRQLRNAGVSWQQIQATAEEGEDGDDGGRRGELQRETSAERRVVDTLNSASESRKNEFWSWASRVLLSNPPSTASPSDVV